MHLKKNLIFKKSDTAEQKKLLSLSYEMLIKKAENNNYQKWLTNIF